MPWPSVHNTVYTTLFTVYYTGAIMLPAAWGSSVVDNFLEIDTFSELNMNESLIGVYFQVVFEVFIGSQRWNVCGCCCRRCCESHLGFSPWNGVNTCSALVVFGDLWCEYFMLTAGRRVCVSVCCMCVCVSECDWVFIHVTRCVLQPQENAHSVIKA